MIGGSQQSVSWLPELLVVSMARYLKDNVAVEMWNISCGNFGRNFQSKSTQPLHSPLKKTNVMVLVAVAGS